jgi:hypothetical protein
MSNLAYSTLPASSPRREQPQRQIEIVSTRAQRRARPRPLYALVAIGGLFALFMAQLLMSIVVSDGAYQISSLQSTQADLTRQQQSLGEQVDTLASTQNLAVKAQALGMVQSQALPAFLDVTTGKVTGTSHTTKAATSGDTDTTSNLIANSLLPDATAASTSSTDTATTGTASAGTTTTGTATTDAATTATATGTTVGTTAGTTATTSADPTEDPDSGFTTDTAAGAPALSTGTSSVASQSGLPIPVTR